MKIFYLILIFFNSFMHYYFAQTVSISLELDATITKTSYNNYTGYNLYFNYCIENINLDIGPVIGYANTTLHQSKSLSLYQGDLNTFLLGFSISYYPIKGFYVKEILIKPRIRASLQKDLKNYTGYTGSIIDFENQIENINKSIRSNFGIGLIFKISKKIYISFDIGYESRKLEVAYKRYINDTEIFRSMKTLKLNTDKIVFGVIVPL